MTKNLDTFVRMKFKPNPEYFGAFHCTESLTRSGHLKIRSDGKTLVVNGDYLYRDYLQSKLDDLILFEAWIE